MGLEHPLKMRDSSPQINEEQQTKRERLPRSGSYLPYLAAIAMSTAVAYTEKPVEAAEVKMEMTWEQGVAALEDDVKWAEGEQSAIAVLSKDASFRWAYRKQGEKTFVSQPTYKILDTMRADMTSGTLESACEIHTHSVDAIKAIKLITSQEAAAVRYSEKPTLSVPPSGQDILELVEMGSSINEYGLVGRINKAGGYVVHVVMDPSRVWRYRFAHDGDLQQVPSIWSDVVRQRNATETWEQHVKSRVATFQEKELDAFKPFLAPDYQLSFSDYEKGRGKQFKNKDVVEGKRRMIIHLLLDDANKQVTEAFLGSNENSRASYQAMRSVLPEKKRDFDALTDTVQDEWTEASKKGEPSAELYQKLKEAYLRNFTVIESMSYDQIRKDPSTLCRWPEARIKK